MDCKNGGVTVFEPKMLPCFDYSVTEDSNVYFLKAGVCSLACLCVLLPFFIGFQSAGVGWGGDGYTSSIDGYSNAIAGCCAPDAIPKWLDPCYVLHDDGRQFIWLADNGSASCVAYMAESMLAALRS